MTVARDLMTPDPTCVKEDQTLADAARMMRDLDVGALPICGNDDRLKGMLTDRDIVVKCIAEGGDPTTATAGSSPKARRSRSAPTSTSARHSRSCRTSRCAACP